MKQIFIGTILLLFMSAAYAGGSMMLRVYSSDSAATSTCTGTIDTSEGCPFPFLN